MNLVELREYQLEFEKDRLNLKSEFDHINQLRLKFVKNYSIETIYEFELDEYITGKRKPSFCYRIENELNEWGNIHGSPAIKFGVYFGRRGNDKKTYQFAKKFGDNLHTAFKNVKISIVELIKNHEDLETLKKSQISPMFKGKILSIYYPDKFLNIFSASHLNHFINILGLENYSNSELDKQKQILDFKENDMVMKHWSIYEFSKFLYHSFGRPDDELKDENLPEELKEFKLSDFPPIEKVKAEFANLNILENSNYKSKNKKTPKKIDYSRQSKKNKRIGDRGEQIVVQFERKFLHQNGRPDLAEKVTHTSQTDDSAGYDILSFEIDGTTKFIEVKSTLKPIGVSQIFITLNELNTAKEKENYNFYIVYNVGELSPRIWKVKTNDLIDNENVEMNPVLFKVNLKTTDKVNS